MELPERTNIGAMLLQLGDPTCETPFLAGGKASNLSRLAARYPVPPGFCLTTEAYARWAAVAAPESIPSELRSLVAPAYAALCRTDPAGEAPVAVRSSAAGEDGAQTSFAGQYSSFLNVTGPDAVLDAVVRCWASARVERVESYEKWHAARNQDRAGGKGVAVLVQKLVAADVSFVAFSANPVTGKRDEILIEANFGLGESLVGAAVTPDTFVVRKTDWSVSSTISEKHCMTIRQPSGVREIKVPRFLRSEPSLKAAEAVEVARMAASLESEFGFPVDIEGAYQDGRLYLLQCRPISTPVAEEFRAVNA